MEPSASVSIGNQPQIAPQPSQETIKRPQDQFIGAHLLNGLKNGNELGAQLRNYPHFDGIALGWDAVTSKSPKLYKVQVGSRSMQLSGGQLAVREFKATLNEHNPEDTLTALAIKANSKLWHVFHEHGIEASRGTGVSAALFRVDPEYYKSGKRDGYLDILAWGGMGVVVEYYGAPAFTVVSNGALIANGSAEFMNVVDPTSAAPHQKVTDPEKKNGVVKFELPLAIVKSVYAVSRSLITDDEVTNPDTLAKRLHGFRDGTLEYKMPLIKDNEGKMIEARGPRMSWVEQFTRDSLEKNGRRPRETLLTGVDLLKGPPVES